MKSLNEITLGELMGEDIEVWIERSKEFGYDLQLSDYDGHELLNETRIHPCAMDSYADMCRRFVHFYDSAKAKMEADL
ncbi:MAG TPA: hypothetical protein VNU45_09195 [Rummeliibacillus sp.]|nr:hypothetical protein [Rummeliibacillus sp.]